MCREEREGGGLCVRRRGRQEACGEEREEACGEEREGGRRPLCGEEREGGRRPLCGEEREGGGPCVGRRGREEQRKFKFIFYNDP